MPYPLDDADLIHSSPVPFDNGLNPIDNQDIYNIDTDITTTQEKKDKPLSLRPKKKILHLHQAHPVQDFFQWASTTGIRMRKLFVFQDKNTRKSSVKTGEVVKQHEKILEVPSDLFINANSQEMSKTINSLNSVSTKPPQNLKEFKSNIEQITLAKYLLDKEAKSNKFVEFLYTNTDFQSFPFFYDHEENEIIKGSFFKSLVDVKKHSLAAEHKILINSHIISEQISKNEYIKARLIVMANSVKIYDSFSGKETTVMVPVLGLFDHKEKKNVSMKINQNNEVEVIADKSLNTNEKVVIDVGSFNNYENLIYFGYTKQNKNKIEITLKIDLPINMDSKTNNVIIMTSDLNINKNLKIFRKIANSNSSNIYNKHRTYFSTPSDFENEVLALKLYKSSLKGLIKNYQTSIQQDIDNFRTNENENIINILRVLIEEKKIILRHLNSNLIFLKILQNQFFANPIDLNNPSIYQGDINANNLNVINQAHISRVTPMNTANIAQFQHAIQINDGDLNVQSVNLPVKQSKFILNNTNLKKYFDMIKNRFNLNYELSTDLDYNSGDHSMLLEDEGDISDLEDLFVEPVIDTVQNSPIPQPVVLPTQNFIVDHPAPLQPPVPAFQTSPPIATPQPVATPPILPHRFEPGLLEIDVHPINSNNYASFVSARTREQYDKENPQTNSNANTQNKNANNNINYVKASDNSGSAY